MDSHSWVLWVGVIAAVMHVMEEHAEGWVAWANEKLAPRFGITFTETDFMLTNAGLVFIALAGAAIGWWAPAVSLAVPALFIINAVFFHMLPSARDERLTPGTLSAVFIYLPVAAWMFWAAGTDDQLTFGTFVFAFVLGAAIMAYPILVLVLRNKIGWEAQTVARATAASAMSATNDAQAEQSPFEATPADQVEDQIEAQPVEPDEGTATTILVADGGEGEPETALDEADGEGLDEDATTELRRD